MSQELGSQWCKAQSLAMNQELRGGGERVVLSIELGHESRAEGRVVRNTETGHVSGDGEPVVLSIDLGHESEAEGRVVLSLELAYASGGGEPVVRSLELGHELGAGERVVSSIELGHESGGGERVVLSIELGHESGGPPSDQGAIGEARTGDRRSLQVVGRILYPLCPTALKE
ncbi:hypothetical protein PoB_002528300 [Plakobranchus ocellatus]|uniref:Uncharacterized protein n=1 Tax=Plakobranchus ocellatus TaxID=259542 RepID=A0AAV3ZV72_9GAST|nr:hypothetical protein PoB_002528300 [Plakobranchus ocellatus]